MLTKLLTPAETAELLGVRPQTLAEWRCTKRVELAYVKIGHRVMYRPEDLTAFIEQRTVRD
jgi:hypothetical protein